MSTTRFYSAAAVAAVVLLGIVGYAQGAYGTGTESFDSIRIGRAGVGGVTFFNGTIVNETTNAAGIDNPVVFGDSMRIDGRIWRGEIQGPGDSLPVIVDDDLTVTGTIRFDGGDNLTTLWETQIEINGVLMDEIIDIEEFFECVPAGLDTFDPITAFDWEICAGAWNVYPSLITNSGYDTATFDALTARRHERAEEIAGRRAQIEAQRQTPN